MKNYYLKRFVFEKSSKYIYEKHKHILPALEFWSETLGNLRMVTFRLIWWRWWIKFGFMVVEKLKTKKNDKP